MKYFFRPEVIHNHSNNLTHYIRIEKDLDHDEVDVIRIKPSEAYNRQYICCKCYTPSTVGRVPCEHIIIVMNYLANNCSVVKQLN